MNVLNTPGSGALIQAQDGAGAGRSERCKSLGLKTPSHLALFCFVHLWDPGTPDGSNGLRHADPIAACSWP